MFKIPDWGNDIPASNVDVAKVFSKKNKNKTIKNKISPKSKTTVTKKKNKSDNINKIGKPKTIFAQKHNNHTILSKDDHIKNRLLKRSLKNLSDKGKCSDTTKSSNNVKSKIKTNVITNGVSKFHNKNLKSKKTLAKNEVNNKCNNERKTEGNNENNIVLDNNVDHNVKNQKSRKRNHEQNDIGTYYDSKAESIDIQSLSTDEPDKVLVNAKRKKHNDKIRNDDIEEELFGNKVSVQDKTSIKNNNTLLNNNTTDKNHKLSPKVKKIQKKKQLIKAMLKRDTNRNIINTSGNKLRTRMMEKLKAAQFRYLNEKLYTSSGSESQELFKSDPVAFQTYHEGYQLQVKKWPVNPLDLIVKRIQKMPKTHLIADMGCGEAALSKCVPNTVRSFDLVAAAPGVEACNMAHTPLLAASVDIVVYCLALMGTDLTQYLLEANRVLKIGGHLLVAEVESRFENAETFSSDVQRLGFSLKKMDKSHKVFFFMEFTKVRDAPAKKNKLPILTLKPCLYKRR